MARKSNTKKVEVAHDIEDRLKALDEVKKDLTKRYGDGTLQSLGEAKNLDIDVI